MKKVEKMVIIALVCICGVSLVGTNIWAEGEESQESDIFNTENEDELNIPEDESGNDVDDVQKVETGQKENSEEVNAPNRPEADVSKTNARVSESDFKFVVTETLSVSAENTIMSIREKGSAEWTELPVIVDSSSGVSKLVFKTKIKKDIEYEYVLNYYTKINTQTYWMKVSSDSLLLKEDNTIVHNVVENYIDVVSDADSVNLSLVKHPTKSGINKFMCTSRTMFTSNLDGAHRDTKIFDDDGTQIPMVYSSAFSSFYFPGGVAYPKRFHYVVKGAGYKTASADFILDSSSTSHLENITNHATEYEGGIVRRIKLNLEVSQFQVKMEPIVAGTTVKVTAQQPTTTVSFGDDSETLVNADGHLFTAITGTNLFRVDLNGEAEDTITLEFVAPDFATVTMKVKVSDDYQFEVLNMEEVENDTSLFNVDTQSNLIKMYQLVEMQLKDLGNGTASVSSSGMKNIVDHNVSGIYPGQVKNYAFRIVNHTGKTFYYSDYQFESNAKELNNAYRINSAAIRKYYDLYNPSIPHGLNGNAEFIFAFESINGISLYDGLLKMYQLDYPAITKLEELPDSELANIFGNRWQFSSDTWGGDPNADYAVRQGDMGSYYAIKEMDSRMLDLAKHHFFANGLYLSLDSNIASLGAVSSSNSNALQFGQYEQKSEENKEMMNQFVSPMKTLKANDVIDFRNMEYVAVGDLIHDGYRPSLNTFNFNFTFYFTDGTTPPIVVPPVEPEKPLKLNPVTFIKKPSIYTSTGPKTMDASNINVNLSLFFLAIVSFSILGIKKYLKLNRNK